MTMEQSLKVAVRAVLALTLALIAVFHGYRVWHRHRSYGEGPIVALAERMRSEPVSASWMREPPYTLTCYGPGYYWAINAVAEIGGWQNSLVPGRLVSLVAALSAAALAALAAARHTQNVELGLLAAVLFLVSLPINEWLPYARVDLLAIAFSAAAYLFVGPGRLPLAASAAAIAIGSLVKPTVALSALPIAAHLVATRRPRDTIFFLLSVAVLGAAAWGVVHWATNGFFLAGIWLGNRNPMYLWRGYLFTYQFLLSPLAMAALMVAAWRFVASPRRFAQSLFAVSFVLSLGISAVMVCKRGSEINYFLEPALLAGIVLAVEGGSWLWTFSAGRTRLAIGVLSLLVAMPYVREMRQHGREPSIESPAYATARHWLDGEAADVGLLADGRMVPVALAAGHQPWLNDSFLYMLLVENGTLDDSPLVERLSDGRIKWLFLRHTLEAHREAVDNHTDCWPPEVLERFPHHYELVDESDGLYVYRHRRFSDTLTAKK
ncbi:MAG TPA: hypothetical protein VFI31_03705 [Pirellulales bacterium]|nr:hypothetical protein [Pirellulales bacterium]